MSSKKKSVRQQKQAEMRAPSVPTGASLRQRSEDGPAVSTPTGMHDARITDTGRQQMATQVGMTVGNAQLARFLQSNQRPEPPGLQRVMGAASLGGLLLANTLAAKSEVERIVTENPVLASIEQEINRLTPKNDLEDDAGRTFRGEENASRRKEVVNAQENLRARIPVEVTADNLGISADLAKAVRRRFYLQLAKIAPFYTQIGNSNILPHPITGKTASLRTCNVSTVSMVLEGLGKGIKDFGGDFNLMNQIAANLEAGTNNSKELRFPDFLQVLAVYIQLVRQASAESLVAKALKSPVEFSGMVNAAKPVAAMAITSSNNFNSFASLFGVTVEASNLNFNAVLEVFGDYYRGGDKKLKSKLDANTKMSSEKKEALRDAFWKKRKWEARVKAGRDGGAIEEAEAMAKTQAAEIEAGTVSLTEYGLNVETLESDIAMLEKEAVDLNAQLDSAADPGTRQQIKDRIKLNKAELKEKSRTHKKLAKKQQDMIKKLEGLRSDRTGLLNDIANLRMTQSAREAVGSEEGEAEAVEGVLPMSTYKSAVIPLMLDLLGSGDQVIVVLHSHFVKLQAISEESITIHDPGGIGRDNNSVDWETARKEGYFKRYAVAR